MHHDVCAPVLIRAILSPPLHRLADSAGGSGGAGGKVRVIRNGDPHRCRLPLRMRSHV